MKYLKQEEDEARNLLHNKNPKIRAKRLLKVAVVFILVILSLELWTANRLSTYGDKIQGLKDAQARLELENQVLGNVIAQESSLNVLEKRAVLLGFGSVKTFQYLNSRDLASLR